MRRLQRKPCVPNCVLYIAYFGLAPSTACTCLVPELGFSARIVAKIVEQSCSQEGLWLARFSAHPIIFAFTRYAIPKLRPFTKFNTLITVTAMVDISGS